MKKQPLNSIRKNYNMSKIDYAPTPNHTERRDFDVKSTSSNNNQLDYSKIQDFIIQTLKSKEARDIFAEINSNAQPINSQFGSPIGFPIYGQSPQYNPPSPQYHNPVMIPPPSFPFPVIPHSSMMEKSQYNNQPPASVLPQITAPQNLLTEQAVQNHQNTVEVKNSMKEDTKDHSPKDENKQRVTLKDSMYINDLARHFECTAKQALTLMVTQYLITEITKEHVSVNWNFKKEFKCPDFLMTLLICPQFLDEKAAVVKNIKASVIKMLSIYQYEIIRCYFYFLKSKSLVEPERINQIFADIKNILADQTTGKNSRSFFIKNLPLSSTKPLPKEDSLSKESKSIENGTKPVKSKDHTIPFTAGLMQFVVSVFRIQERISLKLNYTLTAIEIEELYNKTEIDISELDFLYKEKLGHTHLKLINKSSTENVDKTKQKSLKKEDFKQDSLQKEDLNEKPILSEKTILTNATESIIN